VGGIFLLMATGLVALFGLLLTIGLIVHQVKVQRYVEADAVVTSSRALQMGVRKEHKAVVTWEYEVEGRKYEGDNREFAPEISKRSAQADAAEYEAGQHITVYYDPEDHDDSVLQKKLPIGQLVGKFIGPVAMMLAFVLIPIARVRKKRGSTP
jgi:hypothetical protein